MAEPGESEVKPPQGARAQRFQAVRRPREVPQAGDPLTEKLQAQGIDFSMAKRIVSSENFPMEVIVDPKTGLVIETDSVRAYIATEFTKAVTNGKKWIAIYADADNLKHANAQYGRQFGDKVIQYGAATVSQIIDRANLSRSVEILATRQDSAGDETSVWCFGVEDDEIERIKQEIKKRSEGDEVTNPPFKFCVTIAAITNDDPRVQEVLQKTKEWARSNSRRPAYQEYQKIVSTLDSDVREIKIAKDLERLPTNGLVEQQGLQETMRLMTTELGDSRISAALLDVLLRLQSVQTVRLLGQNSLFREKYLNWLQTVGVDEEELRHLKTPEDIRNAFRNLFGHDETV